MHQHGCSYSYTIPSLTTMPTIPHQSTHVDNEKHGKIKRGVVRTSSNQQERETKTRTYLMAYSLAT